MSRRGCSLVGLRLIGSRVVHRVGMNGSGGAEVATACGRWLERDRVRMVWPFEVNGRHVEVKPCKHCFGIEALSTMHNTLAWAVKSAPDGMAEALGFAERGGGQ